MSAGDGWWAEVDALRAEAEALPPDARAALLDRRCAGRPRLRAEVEALLFARGEGIASRDLDVTGAAARVAADRPEAGAVVGGYRLQERLGEGGMGRVFRATRADDRFAQQVAVKLMRTAVDDGDAIRRFKAERQILASLSHPHIVSLLDGDITPAGQAYLVMELVDGLTIVDYCREKRLGLRERVALLREVCVAVHYAHRRGIVHRDLKPANVLVSHEGVPKVVDFGIAKLLAPDGSVGHTLTGMLSTPLTPNYASPEQVRGLEVTTASDVYSLGVVLYEIVAGRRPYDTAGAPLDKVVALIVAGEPPRPSQARAQVPDAELPYAARALKGELDTIVMKAIAKEPERRYASAGELAEDLQRFLDGQPLVAREPSFAYLAWRLASRHRVAATSLLLAVMLVIGAFAVALWQRSAALEAQARAERRFADVRQLATALLFKIHDGVAPLAGSTSVRRSIVAEALTYLERLRAESSGDPTLTLELATAYRRIAEVLGDPGERNLGDPDGGLKQITTARALLEADAGRADVPVAWLRELVEVYRVEQALLDELERPDAARRAAALALSTAQRLRDREPGNPRWRETLAAAEFHVALAAARPDKIAAWQRVRTAYDALLAEKPDDPARLRNAALAAKYLGGALEFDGQSAAAVEQYRRALALDERQLALKPDDEQARFDVAIDLSNVAGGLMSERKPAEAVILYERSVALREQMAAVDPDDDRARSRLLVARIKLAYCYFALQRRADAARLLDLVEPLLADRPGRTTETWRLIERTRVLSLRADLAPAGRRRCDLFAQALDVWTTLAGREPLSGVNAAMRDDVRAALARCTAAGSGR